MTVRFTVDMDAVLKEVGRLAAGPAGDGTTFRLEGVMLENFATIQEDVHILTGHLKASGHPSSTFDGEVWEGTISFARHPGIFELARGNKPTHNHPEGGHYFFRSSYTETPHAYEDAIMGFLRGDNG